jgi:predicted DNA-binding transcriptional regulator YafY
MECVACDDGRLEVQMPYADERWLAQEVLRFLGDAVLEQPMPARQRVRDLAKVLLVRYGSDNPAPLSASAAVGES